MSDKNVGLSRRQMLAGLGTIGVASVGAGLGTSALFTDQESFTNNQITAGTLDMTVTATVEDHVDNEYWNGLGLEGSQANGEPAVAISVGDVKPGDWVIVCFEIEVGENPGYVRARPVITEDAENGYTEPEPGDDTPEDGELDDHLLATVYGSYNDGELSDPLTEPTPVGDIDEGWYDLGQAGPEAPIEVCVLLEVPLDTGNVIQGDSLSFDLVFETEQVRNNDDPFGTPTPS